MNKQLILKKRPIGLPEASTWELQENPISELEDGQALIKVNYV